MVEIFELETSECISLHNGDNYENPQALHNRHDFRRNFRVQVTEEELSLLEQECAVRADGVKYGSEKPIGRFWIVGKNGQLKDKDLVFGEDRYLVSGKFCNRLRKEGYIEVTTPMADFSILLKRR